MQGTQRVSLAAQPITHSGVSLDQPLGVPLDVLSVLFGGLKTIGQGGNVDLATISDCEAFADMKSVLLGGG